MLLPAYPSLADVTFRPLVELRQRYERRTDRDFNRNTNDNRADLLARTRLGFEAVSKGYTARVQFQLANDELWTQDVNRMNERRDLRLGHLEWKNDGDLFTVGRQAIKKARLLGECDWNNVGVTVDAARMRSGNWDLMAGRLGVTSIANHRTRLEFASYRSGLGETLFFARHDPGRDVYTLNQATEFKASGMTFNVDVAGQLGREKGRRIESWAYAARMTRPLDKRTTLIVDAVAASGGQSGGTIRTFDQGISAYHGTQGLADMQGWRNTEFFGISLRHRVNAKLELTGGYFALGLRDPSDAWYSSVGRPNRGSRGVYLDPTGRSGRDVGDDYGVEAKFRLSSHQTLTAGVALFKPGQFVKSLSGNQDQLFGFVMTSYRF